ncbi:FAD-binding oxidoreductase [Thermoplasma sp. Kam2015]|uniref:NAD(P)/FAD-dependent oxidoreductase n=1 Tax=Thermoplasma sp. Kam2015 TaxID=2094122 RepID=UPI00191C7ED1|nr:FAD-binding oxidoreductase [Thermoplasma sp. Kam2015]
MKYDIAIIGAGIVGLSTAFHLSEKHGDLKIAVIDKFHTYAQGNTGKSAAGFRDVFSSDTSFKLSSSSIRFYDHVQKILGIDLGMKHVGYLFLMDNDSSVDVIREIGKKTKIREIDLDLLGDMGISTKIDDEIREAMGLEDIRDAYLALNAGIMEPDKIAAFYYQQCVNKKIDFFFDTSVQSLNLVPVRPINFPGEPFIWQDKFIKSISTNRGEIYADTFILATDVWTNFLTDPIGIDSHIRPKKRQLFKIKNDFISDVVGKNVLDTGSYPFTIFPKGVYIRPSPQEKTFWAGVADDIGRDFSFVEDPEAEPEFYTYNVHQVLQAYMKPLSSASVTGMWAGYYSYNTIDGNPYIFRSLNLIVATGTSGSGIMKGDAIGRVVAALYDGEEKAKLYDGMRINTADLGVKERKVEEERLVL